MSSAMRRALVVACGLLLGLGAAACGRAPAAGARPAVAPPLAERAEARVAAAPAPERPQPVPILMYHVIGPVPAKDPLWRLYVAPDLFAAQMAALREAGYQAVTLQQAYDAWQGRASLPAKPIVLSFDDGYAGVFEHAVPLLRGYGWPAVLNLQTGRLGVPGGLTVDQVRTMIADGWEVDDHTVTHPDLTAVSPERLRAEIVGAAETIRRDFGVPVRFFCYPAGRYDPEVVAAVRAAGFLAATTTWPGEADPAVDGLWTLSRIRVDAGESPAALLAELARLAAAPPLPPPPAFPPPGAPAVPARVATATATARSAATASATAAATRSAPVTAGH
jgi:peptidoglycan/xylan/chitin deacetylase (PgdA/CDA1 family)